MSKWEWKKLGDLYPIVMGKTPPRGDSSCWDKQKNTHNIWISIADISANENGVIRNSKEYISNKSAKNIKLVSPGSLLISFKLSIGKMAFAGVPLYTNEAIISLPPREDISLEYLHKYFLYFDWDKASSGDVKVKGKTLNKEKLKNIDVLVPPLAEQKRIVKFLDEEFSKIDTLKTNAETNLKNVKDLFKVELLKEFSTTLWEKKKLGEVYNFIDYRGVTPNKLKEGIPLITAKNVRMGYIDYSVRDFISESDYKKRQSRGIAHKGDILFTTEAPLGFSAIADLDVFSTGQRVIVFQQFKNEKNICNPFFNWYFQSIEFQRMIKENATGLTATGIKASRLKEIKIPLPPLSVQKEIVARLDKLSENVKRLEANYKQIIANCDELKKSILKKTFEGES